MDKHAKVERYKWSVGELRKCNIMTFASIICGFPGETDESVAHSIEFIEEAQPTFFNVQLYYHDPRSPIAKRTEEQKMRETATPVHPGVLPGVLPG